MSGRSRREFSSRTPYDDNYSTCERAVACFRVYGDTLDPSQLTELLGLRPTSSQSKGQIFTNSSGRQRTAKMGNWILSTEKQVDSRDLRRHLDWLLGVLLPRADVVRRLRATSVVRTDINCIWWSKYGDGGPIIGPTQQRGLAELDLELGLDVSFFGDEEE